MICLEKSLKNDLENKWFLLFFSLVYLDSLLTAGLILWMTIPLYLIFIVRYVMKTKGYGYKLYVPSIFSLLVLEGLLLVYIYLFDSMVLKIPGNLPWFVGFVMVTILLLFLYLRLVVIGEYKKLPS